MVDSIYDPHMPSAARLSLAVSVSIGAALSAAAPQPNPFLGAWNISGSGQDRGFIAWLEVTENAGQLSGMFLNTLGSPAPLGTIRIDGGELVFRAGSAERPSGPVFRAKIENGRMVGHHTVTQGNGRRGRGNDPNAPPPAPPTQRDVSWTGLRPPVWPNADANAPHAYGKPVMLFDNQSLDMWTVQFPSRPIGWRIEDGAMTNAREESNADQRTVGNNLVSTQKFWNFRIDAEYRLADGSNSGLYLRGRYELQLLDDATANGRPDYGHMAIYGRTPPLVKASKPAGEWQTMEAIVAGNRVTVTLNGQRVHDNTVILGVTGGMLDNDELSPGPIMIQGDHRAVWIRKLVVTPIR